jgi:hypothetical protein
MRNETALRVAGTARLMTRTTPPARCSTRRVAKAEEEANAAASITTAQAAPRPLLALAFSYSSCWPSADLQLQQLAFSCLRQGRAAARQGGFLLIAARGRARAAAAARRRRFSRVHLKSTLQLYDGTLY